MQFKLSSGYHHPLSCYSYELHDHDCRSHDSGRIVSGREDRVVILTDVGTGKPVRKFRGHLSVILEH